MFAGSLLDLIRSRIDELAGEDWVADELIVPLRQLYESRIGRLEARRDGGGLDTERYHRLRRELLAAERAELRRREREGTIGFSTARRIERQLDHEESALRGP